MRGRLLFSREQVNQYSPGAAFLGQARVNAEGSPPLLVFELSPEFQKFAQKPGCLAAREEPRCDCQAGFVCSAL